MSCGKRGSLPVAGGAIGIAIEYVNQSWAAPAAVLFLVAMVLFAAYLAGPKFGAVVYNAAHSYLAPVTLMTSGLAGASPLTLSIAMIWLAHIGIDRALGYGLKYAEGFSFTHLGRIGKAKV